MTARRRRRVGDEEGEPRPTKESRGHPAGRRAPSTGPRPRRGGRAAARGGGAPRQPSGAPGPPPPRTAGTRSHPTRPENKVCGQRRGGALSGMRECGSERKRRHICSAARACAPPSPGRGGGRVGRGRSDPPPRPPRPRRRAARGCGAGARGPRGTLTLGPGAAPALGPVAGRGRGGSWLPTARAAAARPPPASTRARRLLLPPSLRALDVQTRGSGAYCERLGRGGEGARRSRWDRAPAGSPSAEPGPPPPGALLGGAEAWPLADLPLCTPPPSPQAWAFRHWSPKATAPHPTLNQLPVL
ncbi:translation initiation factor IF-2-like [Cervus canadensis]|uniref:translation initiation factor IF-2-like n=1 Tax=Cervus canadensis TaxID=1574408 RepID=UPI001C9E49C5|nr:translation initiation factor IF-2-like [Cervus canadensis]